MCKIVSGGRRDGCGGAFMTALGFPPREQNTGRDKQQIKINIQSNLIRSDPIRSDPIRFKF